MQRTLTCCLAFAALFFAGLITLEYFPLARSWHLYQQGRYDDALRGYQFSLALHPASEVLLYNAGAALYKKGQYKEAASYFNLVLDSGNASLARKASYNLGNCSYRSGQGETARDPGKAIRLYSESIAYYDKALGLDTDAEARYNKDLVLKRQQELITTLSSDPKDQDRLRDAADSRFQQASQPQPASRPGQELGTRAALREDADDLKESTTRKGKASGKMQFKEGEITREEAELFLDAFRTRENSGLMLTDKAKQGYFAGVEKDW